METNKTRGRTRRWIQRRATKGYNNNIVKELRFEDTQGFSDMFRMNYSTFQEVLRYIEHEITPNEVMGGHRVISPGERLTLTLRFLSTGETLLLDPTSWIVCTNGSNMLEPFALGFISLISKKSAFYRENMNLVSARKLMARK